MAGEEPVEAPGWAMALGDSIELGQVGKVK